MVIFKDDLAESNNPTFPKSILLELICRMGLGELPLNPIFAVPPSDMTVTVSMNVPNEIGLNFTVSPALSPPATVTESLVAVNVLVFVVILLIVIALIEVFLRYAVIVAESPLTCSPKTRKAGDTLSSGAGALPDKGILTNGSAELLRK